MNPHPHAAVPRSRPHASLRRAAPLLLAGLLLPLPLHASRLSEPDTVLYGRIVERLGPRDFPITRGELVWIVQSSAPGSPEVRLATRLQPLAGGRYSYQLRIPHEVLAYDLRVRPGAVGLTATPARILHRSVTLDGRPLAFLPGAVDGFSASQTSRASALRLDLETAESPIDTDGDGAPDRWEDQQGLDRFDPTDAAPALVTPEAPPGGSPGTSTPGGVTMNSFAAWRAAWFPGASGDLDRFGSEDADRDGIANLLEYAFNLDPTRVEQDAGASLPRAVADGPRRGVAFAPRDGATDLEYRVETSTDLLDWKDAGDELESVTLVTSGTARTAHVLRTGSEDSPQRFFRVRVHRR